MFIVYCIAQYSLFMIRIFLAVVHRSMGVWGPGDHHHFRHRFLGKKINGEMAKMAKMAKNNGESG